MKKAAIILFASMFMATLWAQSPEKMSYQAVVRNSSNELIANTKVGIQISILQGSVYGASVYVETQTPTTNVNGLVSIEIGGGTVKSGSFTAIDWANGPYFIKTETDPSGGTSYSITGTSQILSVPYALHAKTADALTNEIIETDPVFSLSQAANITNADITNLGNLSGINTGDQDLSGYATTTALDESIQWTANDSGIVYNSGNVGIGSTLPAAKLEIKTSSDSAAILKFYTDRAWQFEQMGTGASTRLHLRSLAGNKRFNITDYTHGIVASFYAYEDGKGGMGIGREGSSLYKLDVEGEITSRTPNAFRLRGADYSAFLRNDGNAVYFLLTDSANSDGDWNAFRPFKVYLKTGDVSLGNHSVFVQHGGNVGIGATSPSAKLHIVASGSPRALRISGAASNSYTEAQLAGDGHEYRFGVGGSALTDGSANNFYLYDANAAQFRLILNNSGYIGIGTTNPTSILSFGTPFPEITVSTTDGNDNSVLCLSGGGEASRYRGAVIRLFGNEYSGNKGTLSLNSGTEGEIQMNGNVNIIDDLAVDGAISTGNGGIKWKLFSGNTGGAEVTFAHGLDASKIYSITCLLRDGTTGNGMVKEFAGETSTDFEHYVEFTTTNISIKGIGDSFNDTIDTYKVIVWYIE